MAAGIVYDPVYLEHDTGEHPENAGRLAAAVKHLKESGLREQLANISLRPATQQELLRVHSESHINYIRGLAQSGGGRIDADTLVSLRSYEAALYAAGGVENAIDSVMRGEVSSAFALVRPPGHHATRTQAMGFCLFNNIAVGAAHALEKYRLERILILDFDVHHGNGTQSIFHDEPRVNYISVHQSPLFPGTGVIEERGCGNMYNIPLPPGCGDTEYLSAYDEIVMPLGRRFKPQFILVSAGFDAHWTDDIASMCLSIGGYAQIMRRIKALTEGCCGGRLVLSLEGGYNLAALAGSVEAVFDILSGKQTIEDKIGECPYGRRASDIAPLLARCKQAYRLD
jgi:acetoin utilization deacetylase AcuC-like enzyme